MNHLREIYGAIQKGVDVRGYFHWSLLDNFEWTYGFSQRFGLVAVNFLTLERHIRKSAHTYARIAETNSI